MRKDNFNAMSTINNAKQAKMKNGIVQEKT